MLTVPQSFGPRPSPATRPGKPLSATRRDASTTLAWRPISVLMHASNSTGVCSPAGLAVGNDKDAQVLG